MVVTMRSSRQGSASPHFSGRNNNTNSKTNKKPTTTGGIKGKGRRGGQGKEEEEEEELAVMGVRNYPQSAPRPHDHPGSSALRQPWSALHPSVRPEESKFSGWSVTHSVATPPGLDRSVLGSPPPRPASSSFSSRGAVTPQPPRSPTVAGRVSSPRSPSRSVAGLHVDPVEEEDDEELGTLVVKSPSEAGDNRNVRPYSRESGDGRRSSSSTASTLTRPHSSAPKLRTLTPENVRAHASSLASTGGAVPPSFGAVSPRRGGQTVIGGPPSSRSGRVTSRSGGAEFGEGAMLLEELEERMSELSDDFLDFMERMDRAAEGQEERPRGLPPTIASAILDVGLMELAPADILLQQFENHRAWDAAASDAAERHRNRSLAASMGGLDETGRWSPQRGRPGGATSTSTMGAPRRRGLRDDPDVARRQRLLELTTKFMERLRLEEGSELKRAVGAAKARVRDASPGGGGEEGGKGWRGRGSPTRGRGEYVKFPEFSFSGQPPIEELERGQFIKLPVTALGGVEAKFVRDKAATFPLEPVDPSQPLMVAPDGSGRASVNLYSRGRDQLWGEEIRGIAPAPNASTEGAETEVLTYRGPGGAYMRRRVRLEPFVPTEQQLLERSLAKYDRLMAKKLQAGREEAEAEAAEAAAVSKVTSPRHNASTTADVGRSEVVDPALTRQLNMHLAAMTSLFGGFDPSDEYC